MVTNDYFPAKVAPNDAVPIAGEFLPHALPDLAGHLLIVRAAADGSERSFDGVLLHLVRHIGGFDFGSAVRHRRRQQCLLGKGSVSLAVVDARMSVCVKLAEFCADTMNARIDLIGCCWHTWQWHVCALEQGINWFSEQQDWKNWINHPTAFPIQPKIKNQ